MNLSQFLSLVLGHLDWSDHSTTDTIEVRANMDGYDFHVEKIEFEDHQPIMRIHLDLQKEVTDQ